MCRQAAFIPSLIKKEDILDMLLDMERGNTDGFGYGYFKDGKPIVNKTILSLTEIMRKKSCWDFFGDCFKHDSWVLFHSRKSSRGGNCSANTHPFLGDRHIFCHNGTFDEYALVRSMMDKSIKFSGDGDSEVAMRCYEKLGARKFLNLIGNSGVYLALKNDNTLTAVKTSMAGDLKIVQLKKDKVFLISELPINCDLANEEADAGFIVLDKKGEIIHAQNDEGKKIKKIKFEKSIVNNYHYRKSYPNTSSGSAGLMFSKPEPRHFDNIKDFRDWRDNAHYMEG